MVRIGLSLFGYGPTDYEDSQFRPQASELQPVVQWWTRIVHIQQIPKDTYVGYRGTWQATEDTRLAILPAGYADGYPLALSNNATVRVGRAGEHAPVRGAVNMDQLIIDITHIPSADIGTPVEVIAHDPEAPNALHQLAKLANSNCYEMLCRLSSRVPRRTVMTHQQVSGPTALNPLTMQIDK